MQLFFLKWFEAVPIFDWSIFQSCHNMHWNHQTCISTYSAYPWPFREKLLRQSMLAVEMNYPWHACVFLLAVGKGSFWLIYFISTGVDWIIDRSAGLIKHLHCMTKARVTKCVLTSVTLTISLSVFLILTSSSLTSWFLTLQTSRGWHILLIGIFIKHFASIKHSKAVSSIKWEGDRFEIIFQAFYYKFSFAFECIVVCFFLFFLFFYSITLANYKMIHVKICPSSFDNTHALTTGSRLPFCQFFFFLL